MSSENITAQIECTDYSEMIFNYSQNVFITNLEFTGCGGNQMMNVDNFVIRDTTFRGQENRGITLQLIETAGEITNCAFSSLHWSRTTGGAITATNSNINISQSIFENNGARVFYSFYRAYGSVIHAWQSIIYINASTFRHNYVLVGVLYSSDSSNIAIESSEFNGNVVSGVLISFNSSAKVEQSTFVSNVALRHTFLFVNSEVIIQKSEFYRNYGIERSVFFFYLGSSIIAHFRNSSITIEGSKFGFNGNPDLPTIVLDFNNSIIVIAMSEFKENTGLVVFSIKSRIEITASVFDNTTAGFLRGMVLGSSDGTIIINNCNFTNNNAQVIAALNSIVEYYNFLLIVNNSVKSEKAILHFDNSDFIGHRSGNMTVSNNLRSLLAFKSNITFKGNVKFMNNQQLQTTNDSSLQGGAIILVWSNLFLDGKCRLEHNYAENGGAILSIDSNLYVSGNVTVAHNMVSRNGGGVYLADSELICQDKSTFILLSNTAAHKGGGIHAISSSIKATSVLKPTQVDTAILNFTNNIAEKGGGLSLDANAKLVVLKYEQGDILFGRTFMYNQSDTIIFSANSADYGGAVYVDDDTNSGTCTSDPKAECFFQVLADIQGLYSLSVITIQGATLEDTRENLQPLSLHFIENNASISGSTLYGGLLDRCAVSQFAEVRTKYKKINADGGNGIMYFKHVSNIRDMSISSQPIKVCLCVDDEHNCTHQKLIEVKKGETFTVSFASIDEINHPVDGLIHASLKFPGSALASGQATREIPAKCTNLTFNVFSPHDSEQLTLHALDGPCKDANLSKISIDISFLHCSCLIGLQIVETNGTNCICACHRNVLQYMDKCNSFTGAFLRQPQLRAWIAFTNDNNSELSGYLVYPNCPFD